MRPGGVASVPECSHAGLGADTNAAGEGGAVLPITLGPEQGSVLNMPERTAFIRGGSRIVHIPLCRLTGELVRLLKRFLKTLALPLNYTIRPFQFEVLATGIVGKHMPSTPPVLLSPAAFAFDLSLCRCHAPILLQKYSNAPALWAEALRVQVREDS